MRHVGRIGRLDDIEDARAERHFVFLRLGHARNFVQERAALLCFVLVDFANSRRELGAQATWSDAAAVARILRHDVVDVDIFRLSGLGMHGGPAVVFGGRAQAIGGCVAIVFLQKSVGSRNAGKLFRGSVTGVRVLFEDEFLVGCFDFSFVRVAFEAKDCLRICARLCFFKKVHDTLTHYQRLGRSCSHTKTRCRGRRLSSEIVTHNAFTSTPLQHSIKMRF